MRSVLITGAKSRPNASKMPEGTRYERAVLLRLDLATGNVEPLLRREATLEAYPSELPSILFTAGARAGSELFLCTNTELLVYTWPGLELVRSASFPFFNEVHSVVVSDAELLVTSTGLDLVVRMDRATLEPIEFLHALGEPPRSRFDWDHEDYRKINSTKPHACHPNYAFWLDGQIWVTRFNQKDAVCLPRLEPRIDLSIERPHDGHVIGDRIYFTTVNGHVVEVDRASLRISRDFDLCSIEGTSGALGWCRGLLIEGSTMYVGFSRLRATRLRENVRWLRGIVSGTGSKMARITAYDQGSSAKLREYALPAEEIDAVFGILPADD
jgi:hypothetical protein